MQAEIELEERPSGKRHRIQLPCVLGRTQKADLSLPDPAISHQHALISFENGHVWIEDLRSANGVYLNDVRINAKTLLKPGDTILLGETYLRYIQPQAEVCDDTVILHSCDHREDTLVDHQRLKLIYDIVAELSENQDFDVLRKKLYSRIKEIFRHDRGCLALFQEDGSLQSIHSETALDTVPLSQSILNRVFLQGESLLLADAMGDASLKDQQSILSLKVRSALCTPLVYNRQIYGLIYLDRNIPGAYREEDLEFLRTIARIVAPLIENARLLTELRHHYNQAVESLKETQTRLIEIEREAAYMRLAQAMAHEIRNPLMGVGGLVRRIVQSGCDSMDKTRMQTVLGLVERIESVMKEVDEFVKLPPPERKSVKLDVFLQKCIQDHTKDWEHFEVHPQLKTLTSRLLVPLDPDLVGRAMGMILREMLPGMTKGSVLPITIADHGKEIELILGEIGEGKALCDIYDKRLQRKAWSLGLFLNIACKIISDHDGKMLFDPESRSPYPIVIHLPRTPRPHAGRT